jgi:alpha-tubulin suppressor-like RCC1 family protein
LFLNILYKTSTFLTIKDSGDLYTFGWNQLGRLGKDSVENCAEPSLIEFDVDYEDFSVLKVSCGSAHTVVITGKEKNKVKKKISRNIKLITCTYFNPK